MTPKFLLSKTSNDMRYAVFLLLVLAMISCSSKKQKSVFAHYPNLTTLQPPKNQKYHPAKLKIDSATIIRRNPIALLISGRFTNGCSKLYKAGHALRGDTLIISITAWQPANKMCTQ